MSSPPTTDALNFASSTQKSLTHYILFSNFHSGSTQIPEKIWSHPPEWVLSHVRAGQEVFTAEIEEAGFVFEKEVMLPSLKENYFLVFVNP